ncbi:hypothetical protein EC988_001681, partial [Linderina pennispora]
IDSAHPEIQKVHIQNLVKGALNMTSTLNDYYRLVTFAIRHPHLCCLIPDDAYRTLVIQCFMLCQCNDRPCSCVYSRKWLSNFEFLVAAGKLDYVKEVRVVMNSLSTAALGLDIALDFLRINRRRLLSVELLVFLGPGLFTAGKMQDAQLSVAEAMLTRTQITTLYPNIVNIQYCIPPKWGPISKILENPACTGVILFEMLVGHYLSRLISVQVIMPFPDSVNLTFSRYLTCLSLNSRYVRCLKHFPRIPVHMLRRLDLMQVEGVVDWSLFLLDDKALRFTHVEELSLEFARPDGSPRKMPSFEVSVRFPSIKILKVQGMKYSSMNFSSYFEVDSVPQLILYEDPSALQKMSFPLLKCSRNLHVVHLDGLSAKPVVYKCGDLHPLFNYGARLRVAKFTGLEYPLPMYINWKLLRWLYFTASIANRASIENLLEQLPCLETLIMPCFSMNVDDITSESRSKHFDDQADRLSITDESYLVDREFAISESLTRFDILSCKPLLVNDLAKLVQHLPRLKRLGVNPDSITDMIMAILPLVCECGVLVSEFSADK